MVVDTQLDHDRAREDFEYFCKNYLKINPKVKELVTREDQQGPLIPFVWNRAQKRVWAKMCEKISRGLPIIIVLLKARQIGMSTFFCAYLFWHMWRQTNYRSGIAAYKKKVLGELNQTLSTFWKNLPEECRPRLRQGHSSRVSKDDVFFADLDSSCDFTVESDDGMRGMARDGVLCTEVAHYKNPTDFFGGFIPAMSRGPSSILVMESSPRDGFFRDSYVHAKREDNERIAIFIPWWMCPDLYSRPLIRDGRRVLDKETRHTVHLDKTVRQRQKYLSSLAKKEDLDPITDEQMWWYEHYCETMYAGDIEYMRQEFPDDDVTAFTMASKSAFKSCLPMANLTVEQSLDRFPEQQMGTLHSHTYTDANLDQVVSFQPEPREGMLDQERYPGLMVYDFPQPGYTYTVGSDVAGGESSEDDEDNERAFSVVCVYCCDTHEQVAEWRGKIDPYELGDEIAKIGYWYNTAIQLSERNNMGIMTEHRLKELNYPRRGKWINMNVGLKATKSHEEQWETNRRTKPMMMSILERFIREGKFRVRSHRLLRELSSYRIVNGKYACGDEYSDCIIAASLSLMALQQSGYLQLLVESTSKASSIRSAHGQAIRATLSKKFSKPGAELPEEFDDLPEAKAHDMYDELYAEMLA